MLTGVKADAFLESVTVPHRKVSNFADTLGEAQGSEPFLKQRLAKVRSCPKAEPP